MSMMPGFSVTILAMVGCTPIESGFEDLEPILSVAPEVLDLGDVGVPLTGSGSAFVSNAGLATLRATVTLEGSEAFVLEGATGDPPSIVLELGADEDAALNVIFTPDTYRDYEGQLVITSNDVEHALWTVPVLGRGVDLPMPDIDVSPNTVEAVDVQPGENPLLTFEIENVGDAPLEIGEISLTQEDGDTFSLIVWPAVGTLVYPGDSTPVAVQYVPVDSEGDDAEIHILSNDPLTPDEPVLLLGNGGNEFDRPIAVIDCPGVVLLTGPEWARFDGTGSTDPSGTELTYAWTVLVRPPAADLDIPLDPDDESVVDLYVDVAGLWTMQLVVTNAFDVVSEPAVCAFTAEPEDDIHVELSWDGPASDMDLHVSQEGFGLFDVPEDACWCNKTPDWGAGGGDDDPRLDIDDISGFGPENINILTPVPGAYEVWVHHYDDNDDGAVTATVSVWAGGTEVWRGPRVMLAFPQDTPQEVWHVGTLQWPSGTFTPDLAGNVLTSLTGCQN